MLHSHIHLVSMSALELRMSAPEWVDERAKSCSVRLTSFDPMGGLLQFSTTSAYSNNSYAQTVVFKNWESLVVLETTTAPKAPPQAEKPKLPGEENQEYLPWGELYPGEKPPVQETAPQQAEPNQMQDWLNDLFQNKTSADWGELYPSDTMVKPGDTWQRVYAMYPDLINADISVSCRCPAFRWWGSQYNLETRETSVTPEGVPAPREKVPRTPNNPGYPYGRAPKAYANIICKHLAAVFEQYF